MAGKLLIFVLALVAIMAVAFAAEGDKLNCVASAYAKACASCPFDENGVMDQSCYAGYRASGIACIMATYPIMAAKYQAGNCSQLGACIDELNSCVSQWGSGNDKADCQPKPAPDASGKSPSERLGEMLAQETGSVRVCFKAADSCVNRAAVACEEIPNPCAGSLSFIVLGALAVLLFAGWKTGGKPETG